MPQAAQFRASNLIGARLVRNEPDFNAHSRHRILFHSEIGEKKTVDHVLRTESNLHRTVSHHMHLADNENVILSGSIIAIESDGVRSGDQTVVRSPKSTVGARIMEVPRELLAGHLHD